MRPVAVVTGASAGIGAELARVFAANGHDLVLVARREQRLRELAEEIAASGRPKPRVVAIDLARRDAGNELGRALAASDCEPQYIVNDAGFGLIGHAAELDRAQQLEMVDVNARTLLDLSLAFVGSLARRRGGILNVASVAGVMPGPGSAVYYASKAFALSLSEALHQELKPLGVRVTCLCPGPVPTEFQLRAGIGESAPNRLIDVPAAKVAEAGYRGLMRGKRVVVPGWVPKLLFALVPRIVPKNVLLEQLEARQLARRGKPKPAGPPEP
ncbi:MAG: SDR family oxidoreductase [Xanthobacteraceae bacterium]|nr:SDR family oxidoreductase [Xanthobacteraceae bacterium]